MKLLIELTLKDSVEKGKALVKKRPTGSRDHKSGRIAFTKVYHVEEFIQPRIDQVG